MLRIRRVLFNDILIASNIVLLFLSYFIYRIYGPNEYINRWTIFLNSVLIFESVCFLKFDKSQKNGLVLILVFLLTFFYSLRVITLTFNPFSYVFMRYSYSAIDINKSLLFIIVSSLFLYLGLISKSRQIQIDSCVSKNGNAIFDKPVNIVILLSFSLLFMFSDKLEGTILYVILGYLTSLFFNVSYLLLGCFVFYLHYRNSFSRNINLIFYLFFVIFILGQVFSGSRSALLSFGIIVFFAYLSVNYKIYLKFKYILVMFVVMPISFIFFYYSTILRQNSNTNLTFSKKIELLLKVKEIDNCEKLLSPVFDRIGFLDYTTEIVTQKKEYSSVLNYCYYYKSFIDNVFSPGFNLYDTPRVSNALIFIYNSRGVPTLKNINSTNYQSDQLTIFGEIFVLFGGWFSIVLFYFVGRLFSFLIYIKVKDYLFFTIKNAFVYFAFYKLINSFGLDWYFFDVISFIVVYHLLFFIFRLKFVLLKEYF